MKVQIISNSDLKLFEKFVAGDIDVPACEKLFVEKTGLLKETDF